MDTREFRHVHRHRQRFLVVSFIGLAFWLTGVITWSYPPEYLTLGKVWAVTFIFAGWLAWMTLIHPRVWLATLAGGLLVGSALFRAGAIFVELGLDRFLNVMLRRDPVPLSASFTIAGLTWALVAVLVWIGWPQVQAGLIGDRNGR